MLVRLGIWLNVLLWMFPSLQSEASTSPCEQYGVRSFKIENFKRFADVSSQEELCSNEAVLAKHPKLAAVILNAQTTMKRVSKTLNIPTSELFPNGIELTARSGPLGSLDEGASGDSVVLFQFDNWDGDGFDASGFSHELGHVIASTLPDDRAIHDLRSIPFLREGFPDLVAYATTGAVFQHSNDLPQIIDRFASRDLNQSYSYDRTLGFYLETYVYWGLNRICKSLPESALANEHTKYICEEATKNIADSDFKKTFVFSKEHFSSDRCFQFWAPEWEGWSCDMHQVSLPWTSSLVRSGRESVLEVLKLLTQPNVSLQNHHYACHYSGDSDRSHWIELDAKSWRDVYNGFLDSLNSSAKHVWDNLFESSALHLSEDFDQKWELTHVLPQRATEIIRKREGIQNEPVYNRQNPCFQWGSDTAGNPPNCVIACEEK